MNKITIGDKMKISFIKYKTEEIYRIPKAIGLNVEELKEPEEIDNKIQELKEQKYTTIIIPSELASFSEKIYNQYKNDPKINIIITPTKNK
jgi:vacuolar-type H+-ATPase subunit F/Vma7